MSETRLEAIRRYCEAMLGEQVTEVRSSVRDHGGWAGIGIREPDGYRHSVAITPADTAEDVAVALQEAIDRHRAPMGTDYPR